MTKALNRAVEGRFTPEEAQRYLERGYWRTGVITDTLFDRAATTPDRVAIVDRCGSITYARVAQKVRRLAASLARIGIRPGDRVSVQLPNWHEGVVANLALERVGAVALPVPPIYRAKEVGYILSLAEVRLAILPSRSRGFDFLGMYRELWPSLPHLDTLVTVDVESSEPGNDPRIVTFAELVDAEEDSAPVAHVPDPDTLAVIAFTSGSTGDPKGVMLTSNTLLAQDISVSRATGLTAKDVMFIPSTFGHSLGYSLGLRTPLIVGARVVYLDYWKPTEAIDLIAKEKVSFIMSPPTFLSDVLESHHLEERGFLPTLQSWMLVGAVVPTALIEQANTRLPHVRLGYGFGMTEVGAMIVNPPGGRKDKGSAAGVPDQEVEVRVVGADGEDVPRGQRGELAMRSPSLFVGYYKQPELTAESIRPDGFFLTGDQIRLDEDGYVHVTGRIKDLIKRGAENISPIEIEEILSRHPSVVDVAVVGVPDHRLGERVCAVVVPRPGASPTLTEIVDWVVSAGVAKQKCPEQLELMTDLPRTSAGKIHKGRLRKLLS